MEKKIIDFSLKSFISSSFWTERVGPSCAITFIKKHQKLKLGDRLNKIGIKIKNIWRHAAKKNNLSIEVNGINPLSTFKLHTKNWPVTITYFNQEMLKYSILASDRCYANYKHDSKSVAKYQKHAMRFLKKFLIMKKKKF